MRDEFFIYPLAFIPRPRDLSTKRYLPRESSQEDVCLVQTGRIHRNTLLTFVSYESILYSTVLLPSTRRPCTRSTIEPYQLDVNIDYFVISNAIGLHYYDQEVQRSIFGPTIPICIYLFVDWLNENENKSSTFQ